jgi:hypothetical protein
MPKQFLRFTLIQGNQACWDEQTGTSVTLWTRDIRYNSLAAVDDSNFTRELCFRSVFRYIPAVEVVGMWESQKDFQRVWEGRRRFSLINSASAQNHTAREMARERQIPRPWYVGWALVPVTERWLKSLNQGNPLRQVRGILSGYGYSETCLSQTWSPTLGPSCRVLARHG